MTVPRERLDSWKAIAEYLGRDVATVRRWEKSSGLPVRRVAGGRGRSVFAYRSEIDEWLRREREPERAPEPAAETPAPPDVGETSAQPSPELVLPVHTPAPSARKRNWRVAAAVVVAGIAGIAWHGRNTTADTAGLNVEVTPAAIVARTPDGAERWRYTFPPNERAALTPWRERTILLNGGADGVIAGTALSFDLTDSTITHPGRLLWFSSAGTLERTFTFDDALEFGTARFGGPWALTDYRLQQHRGERRLAVAAHHNHWWPGIVTLMNGRWERTRTFVNAGWVEQLHWLASDRLLILGFANAVDGGMAALLDPETMGGQSPRTAQEEFHCSACGPEAALRYIVFPRSEVNRAAGATANRARLVATGNGLVVNTIEVAREMEPVLAVYELSPALDVVRASYGDRYWETHRALEAEGRIGHPRERCPDRDGPSHVEVWDRVAGWRTVRLRK